MPFRGRSTLAAAFLLSSVASGALAQALPNSQPANPQGAEATTQTPQPSSSSYTDGPASAHLLGNLGGVRDTLHMDGIDLRANLVDELATNVSGGQYKALRSANEFNFGADLDLGKMNLDDGGAIHITFTQRWGRSLSQDAVHNLVSVQEIYGTGENFRLTEASFEQSFLDKHLNLSIGRVITENDFADSPILWDHASLYCVFQNNGICGTPVGVPVNSGYTAYPQSTWGGRMRFSPTETTFVKTGVYEVNPTLQASSNGLKISSSGATGAFIPVEIGWRPGHTVDGAPTSTGPLPGDYRLGAYYDTSDANDPFSNIPGQGLPTITGQSHSGRYGFYVNAAQMIWRVPTDTSGGTRSLSVFGSINVGDASTALYRVYAEAGVVLKGTFPGRDDDTIGFAVTDTEVNSRRRDEEAKLISQGFDVFGEQVREIAFELNYTAAVYHGVILEPGTQLVLNPNGIASNAPAWVLGLRTAIKF
jgi:porin